MLQPHDQIHDIRILQVHLYIRVLDSGGGVADINSSSQIQNLPTLSILIHETILPGGSASGGTRGVRGDQLEDPESLEY